MKEVIPNYTFNATNRTVTLTDFTTVRLDRLALITDTTTNQIIYNFADLTVATATAATNVFTLSTLPGGVASTDKLRIDYDSLASDPQYGQVTLGTWDYRGGSAATVTVPAGWRVLGIAAHSLSGGSLTINGGNSVPIPANVQISITPAGTLTAPTIVFTSTDSFFVEIVT